MILVKYIVRGSYRFAIRRSTVDMNHYEVEISPKSSEPTDPSGIKLGHAFYDLKDAEQAIYLFV